MDWGKKTFKADTERSMRSSSERAGSSSSIFISKAPSHDSRQPIAEHPRLCRAFKAAKFPTVKSLDSFDFAALPSLNKALVMELARSEYVERRENIIAVGNPASNSYCSSLHLLRSPTLFVADYQTADAGVGGPVLPA
jgi:hypothetical protein